MQARSCHILILAENSRWKCGTNCGSHLKTFFRVLQKISMILQTQIDRRTFVLLEKPILSVHALSKIGKFWYLLESNFQWCYIYFLLQGLPRELIETKRPKKYWDLAGPSSAQTGTGFHLRLVALNWIITSWANARVKLHSQVHFESKKILGPKKVWVQKILDPKTLSQKKILSSEILHPKNFESKKI